MPAVLSKQRDVACFPLSRLIDMPIASLQLWSRLLASSLEFFALIVESLHEVHALYPITGKDLLVCIAL